LVVLIGEMHMGRGILALAVILAIIVVIIGLGRTPGAVKPEPPAVQGKLPLVLKPEIIRTAKVVLECERPTRLEEKAPDGTVVMRTGKANLGEPIEYLEIPDGWIKTCGLEDRKGGGGSLPGKATYEFELPRADDYYVFIRAKWLDSCGNSVYVRLDDESYQTMEDTLGQLSEDNYQWAWHPVQELGQLRPFHLGAGQHVLELNTREDGPAFDKVLVSTEATPPGQEVVKP